MQTKKAISVKIGGPAGTGVKSVGLMFAKLAVRSGYQVYDCIEYPSLIRGGHNVMQINFSSEEINGPRRNSDLVLAFDKLTFDTHLSEINPEGGIIFDPDRKYDTSQAEKGVCLYGVPLSKLAKEAGESELFINIVALGATTALMGGNLEILNTLIEEEFGDKGEEIVQNDKEAALSGYNYIQENYKNHVKPYLAPIDNSFSPASYMIISGNEAVALGAISAGMQFASIYPMSPASNILHVLAANQEKFGYVYKQPEDEISAITMAIGASYAGVRSMTSTSGGGFCLMTEGYGLAGMTETPVVIIDGMRGSPATGLPTWSEQGDLQFVLKAHQGDFPRIVLAAGDVKEAFELTMQAFNLADKYQTPVVLLLDKNICENDQSTLFFDVSTYKADRGKFTKERVDDFKRYKFEENGISVRSTPGVGNFFVSNSDEHDEYGYSTEEVEERNKMHEKRMQKLKACEKEDMAGPILYGPVKADVTIVSWGSNKGSILEALENYSNVNYLHLTWMNPFPSEELKEMLSDTKHIINIECNYSGQLADLIREKTGIEIKDRLLKYDGRMIYPDEIEEKLDSIDGAKRI